MVQLAEKAKEDAENDNYNPPHGRWPGGYGVGIEARDGYDRAFNLHHSDDGVPGRLSWRRRSFHKVGRTRQAALSLSSIRSFPA